MLLRRFIAVVGLAAFAVLAIAEGAGAEDGSFKVAIQTNRQGPTNDGLPDAVMSMFSIGNRPVFDCQFSAGGWSYSAASFTAPGTGCIVTFSQTTPTTMFGPTGLLTYAPNNQLLNSATLSTQNVISSVSNYILSFTGTGSVVATGTASFTLAGTGASNRVFQVFTPTAGTLTLTVSGSVTSATLSQVFAETTPRPQDQVITGASAYFGPRLDYNPASLAANGLLIEQASTNLALQSNTFSNGTWGNVNAILTSGATTSPDGTADAWLIADNSTNGTHRITQSVTVSSGATVSACLYVKQATGRYIFIGLAGPAFTNGGWIIFDPQTGTVTQSNGIIGTATVVAFTPVSLSDGFYRVGVSVTIAGNTSYTLNVALSNATTAASVPSYAGTGTGDYIYQAQIEVAPVCSSNIPTAASQVSRAADVDSQSVSALNLQTGGALLVKAITPNNNVATQVFAALDDATTNNYVRLIYATNGHVEALIESGGSLQATINLGAVANSTLIRVGVNFVGGQFAASLNGAAVVTASGTMPASLTTVRYGMASSGSQLNSWVGRAQIYKAINNNQLQAKVAAL